MIALTYDPIVVVSAADNNYAMPLSVTIRSAIENLSKGYQINLFIIDGGIQANNKRKILKSLVSEKCKVQFINIPDFWQQEIIKIHGDSEVKEKTINKYISLAAYYRLFIPELLPETIDKAIYLDCDLVVTGDLAQLWQTDLGDNYLLAAQDMGILQVSTIPNGLLNYEELGISSDAKYFNSGVLAIDLKKWRTEKFILKALNYLKYNRKYIRFHDQDVLNAILPGQWGELDPKWNFQPTTAKHIITIKPEGKEKSLLAENYEKLSKEHYIIHYSSKHKPWNSEQTLFKEYFFTYVDMTAWSGWRLNYWRQLWLKWNKKYKRITSKIQKKLKANREHNEIIKLNDNKN